MCDAEATRTFVDGIANASLVMLPSVGHGFSVEKNWMPQFKDAFQHIVYRKTAEDAVNPKPDSLADLPLVENGLPNPKGKPLAIIVTGDGGWASIDRDIGGAMNKSGVNVVGLNSLQYFWSEKTPEQSAKRPRPHPALVRGCLAALQHHADRLFPRRGSAALHGQQPAARTSKAASAPSRCWPSATTPRSPSMSPTGCSPESTTVCRSSPKPTRSPPPTGCASTARRKPPTACVRPWTPSKFTIIKTKGGHHFDGDYNFLADAILKASI